MKQSLSIQEARKLVLLSQRIPPVKETRGAVPSTLSAIEHLGYIQIDTISVIQRAHHHTLWNRNPRYESSHLDQLVAEKKVFEYWAHAAAYLPFRDYRFSLPRKQAIAKGDLDHWYEPDHRLMKSVLKRIGNEGPLMAKDFEHTGKKTEEWKAKPAKRALEHLFMQGELMTAKRVNFHKVYDLTERVLPTGIEISPPTPDEHARFLITRFLQANGLGQATEITYLLRNIKPQIAATLQTMVSDGEVLSLRSAGNDYYALPSSMALLDKPLPRSKLKILSPFDNLVIQRKRMNALFEFDYLIECYVPAAKRRFGYFSLPILWDGRLVARMDCKAERKTERLHIYHLALEPTLSKTEAFIQALCKELKPFLKFNQCNTIQLHKTTPPKIDLPLRRAIKESTD